MYANVVCHTYVPHIHLPVIVVIGDPQMQVMSELGECCLNVMTKGNTVWLPFSPYLLGQFILCTDHGSLTWLHSRTQREKWSTGIQSSLSFTTQAEHIRMLIHYLASSVGEMRRNKRFLLLLATGDARTSR